MKFGQKGKELLLDLKRSSQDYQSETHAIINIPPYNMDAVRSCIDESTYHYSELAALATATPSSQTDGSSDNVDGKAVKQQRMGFNLRPALLLHDACLRKNKRCLLAYHAYRADRVREIRWEGMGGGALGLPEHVLTNMLDVEVEFFSKYDELLSSHCTSINLDLTSALEPPDSFHLIEIRVVSPNVGTIITEDGSEMNLEAGTIHYLQYTDVEHLIRQGLVELLSTGDST